MHFEKGDHEECIKDCDAAVERGRELRADYKTVAKALTRKGTSLVKQGKLQDAIDTYQKALTEHRCIQLVRVWLVADPHHPPPEVVDMFPFRYLATTKGLFPYSHVTRTEALARIASFRCHVSSRHMSCLIGHTGS